MAKKKSPEDVYFPVPQNFSLAPAVKPPVKQEVIRKIIQSTIQGAYCLRPPPAYDYQGYRVKPKPVATIEQVEMVVSLIEALQPIDAIEATLASQYAISYIRGLAASNADYTGHKMILDWFAFGHQVLETLQKFRSKGAQLISVQYNHSQSAQINNITVNKNDTSQ